MPRKSERDKVKSIFRNLENSLVDFTDRLKDSLYVWLKEENKDSEEVMELYHKTRTKAAELRFTVEMLEEMVKKGKGLKNSRFANNVVRRFLESSAG